MGTPPESTLITYYIWIATKAPRLSYEHEPHFVFMTGKKVCDRPPLETATGNNSPAEEEGGYPLGYR